ncbi:hypothetical protein MMC18_005505 [Xylographa bjoerkii]|nr:hypothetical protein [Xylographa bjoerkii]
MPNQAPTDHIDLALPPKFSSAMTRDGRTYYLNHTNKTTSFIHPIQTHYRQPSTQGLPYPYERMTSIRGQAYYADHEARTTSWLNPVKLKELKEQGFLGTRGEPVASKDGSFSKPSIVVEKATAPKEGELYYVNYRTGDVGSVCHLVEDPVAREREREQAGESAEERREAVSVYFNDPTPTREVAWIK